MLPLSPSRYTNQTFDGSSIRLMYSASCWRATKLLVGGTGTAAVARSIAVCCAATLFASCHFALSGTQPASAIGRASCRETASQYVKIQVGADPFKQKKHTISNRIHNINTEN